MQQTSKDAIYDAISSVTGLEGVWENQKGAVKMDAPHFSLKLLFPGNMYERKGNTYYNGDGKQVYLTRKYTTLQVKVFNSETALDKVTSCINNSRFHKLLNAGRVVANYMIRSIDVSTVYNMEWDSVGLVDLYITFYDETLIQPDVLTDEYIDKVKIEADVDNDEFEIRVPNYSDDDLYPLD